MMLTGAVRSTRACLENMNFLYDIEVPAGMTRQQTAQSRRQSGAYDDTAVANAGLRIETEQSPDVADAVTNRYDMLTGIERLFCQLAMSPSGSAQDDDIGLDGRRVRRH